MQQRLHTAVHRPIDDERRDEHEKEVNQKDTPVRQCSFGEVPISEFEQEIHTHFFLKFTPNHLIHHSGVRLDDFHDFRGNIFLDIVGHGNTEITVLVKGNRRFHCLEQRLLVNSSKNKARFVQRFGSFRAGTNTNRRERMTDAGKE